MHARGVGDALAVSRGVARGSALTGRPTSGPRLESVIGRPLKTAVGGQLYVGISYQNVLCLLLSPRIVPSSGVSGIANDFLPPCCPVCCVVLFQPRLCHISLTHIFPPLVWPPFFFMYVCLFFLIILFSFILVSI